MSDRPIRVLCVASGGGHWVELMRLRPAFEGFEVTWVTVSRAYEPEVSPERFYTVVDVTRWNKLRWFLCAFKLLWILLRVRPAVVLSTGALPGFFALRLARLLGRRTAWIDSFANVDELSMSGQRIGKHADLWLTQWEHLATEEGPHYRGMVL